MPQRGEPGFGLPPTVYGAPSIRTWLLGEPEPDGVDMGTRAGMPVIGCGCEVVRKWLTHNYVRCLCGTDLNRELFWEAALSVEVFRPVVHCGRWTPLNLDPEDRYHALECTAKGRAEAAARKDEILANWKAQKPGFFSDLSDDCDHAIDVELEGGTVDLWPTDDDMDQHCGGSSPRYQEITGGCGHTLGVHHYGDDLAPCHEPGCGCRDFRG